MSIWDFLSRKAADALREIAGDRHPPEKCSLDYVAGETMICLECGHVNTCAGNEWNCVKCGAQLHYPIEEDHTGYIEAIDLLRSEALSPEKVQELLNSLRESFSFYMAGTKYSVFG